MSEDSIFQGGGFLGAAIARAERLKATIDDLAVNAGAAKPPGKLIVTWANSVPIATIERKDGDELA